APIRDDADVALSDSLNDLFELPWTKIPDRVAQARFLHGVHDLLEKRCATPVRPQLDIGKRLPDPRQGAHRKVQTVSFDQGTVIHEHEWPGVIGIKRTLA